jgi:hypothetical protein
MKTTATLALWMATFGAVLVASPWSHAADTPAPQIQIIPVAHSALLTINATVTQDGLALHVLHANNQIPIDGRDVTVSVDGKDQPLTVEPEGTFLLSTKDLGEGMRQFDITVAHDGIREILTGKVTLPKTGGLGTDLWRDHKQMAWWILNIGIVLIAVLAFSRRSSTPPKQSDDED